jgi:hypothetical protein
MVSIIILIESNNIVKGFSSHVKEKHLPHSELMKCELGRMNECKQVTWANGEISNSDFTILHSSFGGSPPLLEEDLRDFSKTLGGLVLSFHCFLNDLGDLFGQL